MDVTPFVSNVIQNVCTFDALLTSHHLEWSIVPLQILMALILMEATATPCHLEFVQYLTEWSLHVQQSIWQSHTTPAPAPHPVGINLESEQENPSGSRPKTSDPNSPETRPTPCTHSPITLSKPPVMPMKPEAMPSKIPDTTLMKPEAMLMKPEAMPTKPETMPSKASDDSLKPPATPRKCTLMPQKVIPSGSR